MSSSTAAPSFGTLLRLHGRRLGLTQEDLAEHAGFSVEYIKKLEGGSRRPSAASVDVLAHALELEESDLESFRAARTGRGLKVQGLTLNDMQPEQAAVARVRTFLIADVCGYTRYTLENGDEAAAQLAARFAEMARGVVASRDGEVIELRGDEALAVFQSARQALRAAVDLQASLLVHSLAPSDQVPGVGIGIDSGEAVSVEEGYRGAALNLAARLCSLAGTGEVLVSDTVINLARKVDGLEYLPRGTAEFKGFADPVSVFQVSHGLPGGGSSVPADAVQRNGRRSQLPPIGSLRGSLPMPSTPLIGREREIRELCDLLREEGVRLVTLTGPAGTGKTRLALQVGAELVDEVSDGVFFVSLAPVADPDDVIPAIAAALDVREVAGKTLAELVPSYLKHKKLLLILDNFEQVVEAAPQVANLLQGGPGITALVTSRTVLHLYGERQYAVPPLSLPDMTDVPALGTLLQYESVALFIQRAQAARRTFDITNENAPAVAEICCRLDGLPLAIELAAARVNMLSPEAILQRLSDRMKLLTGGGKDLPARHQTLRAAIEWSFSIVEESEQKLFRRLGVFVDGWTLGAAESVCDPDDDLDVFEGLASLVDKSLVARVEGQTNEPRFQMLETLWEYAREQLEASGEVGVMGQRHAGYFLEFAEEAEPHLVGPDQVAWLDRLDADRDNLLTALGWFVEHGDGDLSARFALAMYELWFRRGYITEGRDWLQRVLSLEEIRTDSRAKILDRAGWLAFYQGEDTKSEVLFTRSLDLARGVADEATAAKALAGLGVVEFHRDNFDAAEPLINESLVIRTKLGDKRGRASYLSGLAWLNLSLGKLDSAAELAERCLTLFQESGDILLSVEPLGILGWVAVTRRDRGRASLLLGQGLRLSREAGNRYNTMGCFGRLGRMEAFFGDYGAAAAAAREALMILRDLGPVGPDGVRALVELLAVTTSGLGHYRRAAELLSAVQPSERRGVINPRVDPVGCELRERAAGKAKEALGEDVWRQACAEGRAMSLDQAVDLALEGEPLAEPR